MLVKVRSEVIRVMHTGSAAVVTSWFARREYRKRKSLQRKRRKDIYSVTTTEAELPPLKRLWTQTRGVA
ncbi:unnamed protein product [Lota lota]